MDRKKRRERRYLDEARRASPIFPPGEVVPRECPDFMLGTLGIEMTELCRKEPRAEGARLGKVAAKAKLLYQRRSGAKPVDVSHAFSHHAHDLHVDDLAGSLADFVYEHRDSNANFSWDGHEALPEGYCDIGVFDALDPVGGGRWIYIRAFSAALAPKELIESRIAEKNERVRDYRSVASEIWLVIVNDEFLGPGEVRVRPDLLAQWTFASSFDKVLLFARQPGGSGEVIELRRP